MNTNIENIFKPINSDISDFDKKKNFIQNNIEYSSIIKKHIIIEKIKNPQNYININEELNKFDNITKDINSKENPKFILSLLGKVIEKNGTQIHVSKSSDQKFKNIELASIQSLFSLGNQKKYELHFDFGKEKNEKILNDPLEQENFIKEYKKKIANELNIDIKDLIFTDLHRGSVGVHMASLESDNEGDKTILILNGKHGITKVEEKPLLEALQISPEILDPFGDRSKGWGINEKRGGELYIPPSDGWNGIGLKVAGVYDRGNNDWLDYRNKKGEFAIAYLGLNNFLNKKEKIIEDLNNFTHNFKNAIKERLYQTDENIRAKKGFFNLGSSKCGKGVCLFQNPEFAENRAGIIDIQGFRIKLILMCRVNPKKIRQPKSCPECWILNPTPDEIRPYRILIKKIPISPLTGAINQSILTSDTPIDYILNLFKTKNDSFLELAKYKDLSEKDGQPLGSDEFAFRIYSSECYRDINCYLRNIDQYKDPSYQSSALIPINEDQIKSIIYHLQYALKNNINVKNDSIVYRGVHVDFPKEIGIGSKFYFREFISTSTDKKKAIGFSGGKTLMIIKIKNNGTNKHPNYCYNIKNFSEHEDEEEVLISSMCYFNVDKKEKENGLDIVHLTCEGYLLDNIK